MQMGRHRQGYVLHLSALELKSLKFLGIQAIDHLMLRKGTSQNVMIFPEADYDNDAFQASNGQFTFTHKAFGADSFRYSWNWGKNWTTWQAWEDTTTIESSVFGGEENFWKGQHIMVQCV